MHRAAVWADKQNGPGDHFLHLSQVESAHQGKDRARVVSQEVFRFFSIFGSSDQHHGCSCGTPDGGLPELDARLIPAIVRPAAIIGAVGGLPAGECLVLVAPHDPAPLLAKLSARYPGLSAEYLSDAPGECRVKLRR